MTRRRDFLPTTLAGLTTLHGGVWAASASAPARASGRRKRDVGDWLMPDEAAPRAASWMAFRASSSVWGSRDAGPALDTLALIANSIVRFEPVNMLGRAGDMVTARQKCDSRIRLIACDIGWERTARDFTVATTATGGGVALNRYFFERAAVGGTRGCHFYTALRHEKDLLAGLNPPDAALPRLRVNDGVDSYVRPPLDDAANVGCTVGEQPAYRLFCGPLRFPDNVNHRFTTDEPLYRDLQTQGWDGEGVKFCIRAVGLDPMNRKHLAGSRSVMSLKFRSIPETWLRQRGPHIDSQILTFSAVNFYA